MRLYFLFRSSHPGPTLLVTWIAYLLSLRLWWEGPSYVIAFTIFTGQLCIGLTNDLIDRQRDLDQGRKNKPLASGKVSVREVKITTYISLTLCVAFSLFGPLGLRGGFVHLLFVGCGIAYNFYFKSMWLSLLPYAVGFAALPSSIILSKSSTVPLWVIATGALSGIAAHFINVLKDMEQDRKAGINGLPQIFGKRLSIFTAIILVLLVVAILINFGSTNF